MCLAEKADRNPEIWLNILLLLLVFDSRPTYKNQYIYLFLKIDIYF